jgi:AcrR family transcriptional regulator
MELTKRQTEIIEVSIKIIDKKGIQGLTIKNLSKEIGISEAAIYRHFDNKTAILVAILDVFTDLSKMFASIMETYEASTKEKIQFMFGKMIDVLTDSPALISVFFSEDIFKNESILKEKVTSIQNRNQATIKSIISKGKQTNDIRKDIDTKSLALIIMGSLRFLVKNWSLNGQNLSLQKEGDKLINAINILISN